MVLDFHQNIISYLALASSQPSIIFWQKFSLLDYNYILLNYIIIMHANYTTYVLVYEPLVCID